MDSKASYLTQSQAIYADEVFDKTRGTYRCKFAGMFELSFRNLMLTVWNIPR